MTKLIIQILCLNEEKALPITLNSLPKSIKGIDKIEILVVNDGSTDRTVEVARKYGVHYILDFKAHKGLSAVFMEGILKSAKLGADYAVNLDADNQYNTQDINKLLEPIMHGKADIVVGERPIQDVPYFSRQKKKLQRVGSFVIRKLSKTTIKDTASGFRALNRKAMMTLSIFNSYTYTHESLVNATEFGLKVIGVPISVNEEVLRPSRLIKSNFGYILKNGINITRLYLLYNPYPIFIVIFFIFGTIGIILILRFLYFYFMGQGAGWIQSLILAGISLTISLLSLMMGIITDTLRINRKLLQKILVELREFILNLHNNEDNKKKNDDKNEDL